MIIRPMKRDDVARIADIGVAAFSDGELHRWMYPRHAQYPNDLRRYYLISSKQHLIEPNIFGIVAESTVEDQGIWTGKPEILGYAFYKRNAKSRSPKYEWHPDPGWPWNYINRPLLAAESWYAQKLERASDKDRLGHFLSFSYKAFNKLDERFHIGVLAVDPAFQGKGIGSKLVEYVTEKAREEDLPVTLGASIAGRRLYTKLGFNVVEEAKISDGVNQIAMVWDPSNN